MQQLTVNQKVMRAKGPKPDLGTLRRISGAFAEVEWRHNGRSLSRTCKLSSLMPADQDEVMRRVQAARQQMLANRYALMPLTTEDEARAFAAAVAQAGYRCEVKDVSSVNKRFPFHVHVFGLPGCTKQSELLALAYGAALEEAA